MFNNCHTLNTLTYINFPMFPFLYLHAYIYIFVILMYFPCHPLPFHLIVMADIIVSFYIIITFMTFCNLEISLF